MDKSKIRYIIRLRPIKNFSTGHLGQVIYTTYRIEYFSKYYFIIKIFSHKLDPRSK